MTAHNPPGFRIGGTAVRLAHLVRAGGYFYDADLRRELGGIHRNSLTYALTQLRELGALDFGPARLGRRRGPRFITIHHAAPVWAVIDALEVK